MASVLVSTLAQTVLLPAGVTGAVLVASWLAWQGRRPPPALAGLALGAGWTAADLAVRGFQGWWPADVTRLLPYGAVLGLALAALRDTLGWCPGWRPQLVIHLVRAAACAALVWLLTGTFRRGAEPLAAVCMLGGPTFLLLALWEALDRLAVRDEGPGPPLVLAAVAGLAACTLTLAGAASLGQLSGALAACLAVSALTPWRATVGGFVLLYGGLVGSAHCFGDLPRNAAVLLVLAPAFTWAGGLPWLARRRLLAGLTQAACCLVVVVLAALLVTQGALDTPPTAPATEDLYDAYYGR